MNINIERIKECFANGEKTVFIDASREMFFFGEEGIIQALFEDSVLQNELKKTLKEAGFATRKDSKKNGFTISVLKSGSNAKRTGYSLILETDNNGNFEEVKRLAKRYDDTGEGLQLCKEGWIVKLNKHNSDIVEKLVENNDTYSVPFAKYVYKGICAENNDRFPRTNYKAVEAMIRVIDRDNSTQVWQHDKNRIKKMAEFIIDPDKGFWKTLKSKGKDRIGLIEKLIDGSRTTEDDSNLVSLSSKVCKYLLEYETGNRDSFFISDRFVRRALPFYCDAFNIPVDNFKCNASFFNDYPYSKLFDVLEKLQKYANKGKTPKDDDYLDKHRIDHILWFCYRNGSEVEDKKRKAASKFK